MHPAFQTPVGYLVLAAALVADPAIGADLDALPALNAAITESSIAGLSSGAFMAVQFATAWSSAIKGLGVTAQTPGNAPDALAVIDTSNTAAVLAWMPVSGATLYRISRAGADGTGWQHRGVEFCRYRTGAANVLSLARDSHHKWIGRYQLRLKRVRSHAHRPRPASNPEIVQLVRQQGESAGNDRRGSIRLVRGNEVRDENGRHCRSRASLDAELIIVRRR